MLLDPKKPKVEPIPNEPFRFWVESSKKGEPPWLVDLEARWPIFRCACPNYECVRWPEFKRTLYAIPCKHISLALEYYAIQDIRSKIPNLNYDGE